MTENNPVAYEPEFDIVEEPGKAALELFVHGQHPDGELIPSDELRQMAMAFVSDTHRRPELLIALNGMLDKKIDRKRENIRRNI